MQKQSSICNRVYNPQDIRNQLLQEAKDRNFEGYESLDTTQLYLLLSNPVYTPSNVWLTPCSSTTKKVNTEVDMIASYSAFSLQELRDIAYKNKFSGYMSLQRHELLKLLLQSNVKLFT